MLEVKVEKKLGEFELKAEFQAGRGVTALFGPSGAGKSTLINLIAGLLRPDRGRIALSGKTLFDHSRKIDLPPERRDAGYVFQEGRLFPHLSVRSNLLYGMRLKPPSARQLELAEVVELMGISHLLQRRPASLSGGEKQRVAMGRALLSNPRLLLMDEPLASLDQARKNEVLPFLVELPRKMQIPIIYVSHSLAEVEFLADRVVKLSNGNMVEPESNKGAIRCDNILKADAVNR